MRDELTAPSASKNIRSYSGDGFIQILWDRSPDTDVVGYTIYRRTAATDFVAVGYVASSPYLDTSVEGGQSYYYRVTAVDTSGNESESAAETAETYRQLLVRTHNLPDTSTAAVGDINGDGQPDLIVGYPKYDSGKGGGVIRDIGKVEMYYGGNTTGEPDVTLVGEAANDEFGHALAVADMNNDGYDDLIVGAPFHDVQVNSQTTARSAGKVYVYAGAATFNAEPAYTIDGQPGRCGPLCYLYFSGEELGSSAAPAGDVNNDGYQDVVVGAPKGGMEQAGSIRVLFGREDMARSSTEIWGPDTGEYMGYPVASAGDVNGDGYADIIAGSGAIGAPTTYGGSAYLLYGPSMSVAARIRTGIPNDGFGRLVSSTGDINGDGFSDFAVSRYIYYGGLSPDKIADRVIPDTPDFLAPLGDVNKDGFGDLLVSPGPKAYFGSTAEENIPDIMREGMSILAAGDIDRDGIRETLVGADVNMVYLYSLASYVTSSLPGITVSTPKNNLRTDLSDITVEGVVTGNTANLRVGGASILLQSDGTFSTTVTLAEGKNYIEIIATTPEGKVSKRVLTVTKALPTPLSVSLTMPVDGTVYNYIPPFIYGTVSDAAASVTINGMPAYVSGNEFGIADMALTEGTNTITATAQDDFGQTATHSVTVMLLTKGMVTGTVTDETTLQPIPWVTVTVQDTQGSQTAMTDENGNYTVPGVVAGGFTATFTKSGYFSQTASGTSTDGQIQTINAQLAPWPPLTVAITSPQPGVTLNTSQVTVTGSVTNNAQVTVNGRQAAVSGGTFSVSVPLSEGVNTLTAVAADSYGQTVSDGISITVLTKGTITGTVTDTDAGLPLAMATASVTDALSTTISTFTDANGNYTMPNVTQGQFSGTITKDDYSAHSFSGTMTAGQTMTINGSITLQPPTLSIPAAVGITPDSVTITWTTDQATDSRVEYGTSAAYGGSVYDATLTTNHSIAITGLAQGTTYHFRVTSTNSHNLSSSSLDSGFTTAAPPVISGVQVTSITTDSVTLAWTTDQPCSSRVEYGTNASYGSVVENAALTLSHSVTLTGLAERTAYHFRITSVNADGIAAQTEDNTLWTRSSSFTATSLGDYGNVTVMEVSGNYNAANPDGSINALPRQEIAKEFFRNHQDDYDFFVVLSNFDFAMPDAESAAFYMGIKNDTQGIGLTQFDSSALFGSSGKLHGMIDMGNLANTGVSPFDPATFDQTLDILSHEQMHRWGAGVKFRNTDGTVSAALLGRDGSHWSYLLDTDGSVLYGNDWQNNSDGTFTSTGGGRYYSDLDLYLMGLIDKTKVPAMTLIENAAVDKTKLPEPGATITGTPRTITIDDIVAAEGERVPAAADAQKAFKVGYIFITTPDTFTGSEPAKIETLRNAWAGRFAATTGGKGSIADVPPSLTVSITSPADNATITGDSVTVSGAIINSTGNETGVTVNGVPATVYGTRFVADHVQLAEGENTITVTATDTAGTVATATVTVTAAAGNYISLISNIESGIAPLTTTMRIDGSFSIESSTLTAVGPAQPEIEAITADEYNVTFTAEGVYQVTASAMDSEGTTYEDTATVVVLSRAEMDALLKAKWEGMKGALLADNIEEALNYFIENSKNKYRDKFTDLGNAKINSIFSDILDMRFYSLISPFAECGVLRVETGGTFSYPVRFVLDADGIWKIFSF